MPACHSQRLGEHGLGRQTPRADPHGAETTALSLQTPVSGKRRPPLKLGFLQMLAPVEEREKLFLHSYQSVHDMVLVETSLSSTVL